MERNDIAVVKYMQSKGYTQKQARIVTGLSATKVSNIWNAKYHEQIEPDIMSVDDNVWGVLNTILERREIPGMGALTTRDERYISLLKVCQVPLSDVYKIYSDLTRREVSTVYRAAKKEYFRFNPLLLGLSVEEYSDFLAALERIGI